MCACLTECQIYIKYMHVLCQIANIRKQTLFGWFLRHFNANWMIYDGFDSNVVTKIVTWLTILITKIVGALNLNIHYHMLFLDGVYGVDKSRVRFRWVKAPTSLELFSWVGNFCCTADEMWVSRLFLAFSPGFPEQHLL
jgi:hypothetical protein